MHRRKPLSQTPGLLTLARRELASAGISHAEPVLLAVSGGADSMALLHTMARLAREGLCAPTVLSFDHGLRASAAAEAQAVCDYSARLGVSAQSAALGLMDGPDLQERARDARRSQLQRVALEQGARWIATGHHADDRAETMLMRILRGTGPAGLAALPASAPPFFRPLIRARRAQLRAHCTRFHVPFVDDPSNTDPRFLRVRVRFELLPQMIALNPRAVEHLCKLADLAEKSQKSMAPPLVSDAQQV